MKMQEEDWWLVKFILMGLIIYFLYPLFDCPNC